MKPTLIFAIVCVFFTTLVETVKSQETRKRSKDAPSVAEQLTGFENGSVSLEKLTEDGGPPLRQEIIRCYTNNPNRVSVKMKLVVSRCFGMEHDFQRAAQLAEAYVAVYTNDYRGWRILGTASMMLNTNDRALKAYMRATKLGDETSYSSMAGVALELNRLECGARDIASTGKIKGLERAPAICETRYRGPFDGLCAAG